jgi:hypothetical protein
MKRLSHLGLCFSMALAAASACDLPDKSIGDEGGDDGGVVDDGGSDAGAESGGSEGGGPGDDGACTLIGCDDMLSISIAHEGLAAGTWTVTIDAPADGGSDSCSFVSDGSGGITDDGCNGLFLPGEVIVQASQLWSQVVVTVLLDGIERGSTSADVAYEDVAPNGPGCGPVCTQGTVALSVSDAPVVTCDDLEQAYASAMAAAQACTEAAECGQTVTTGGSCGCTRAPVARLDADLGPSDALWMQAQELECPFTQLGGPCDCPEADGFACIDDLCTWNYL